jgi:hypothetical protein
VTQAETTSNEEGTASNKEEYICWVEDFLSQDIPSALRRNIRVFFFNHDSYWKRDAIPTRLRSLGEKLLNCLRTEIRSTEEVCRSYQRESSR